MSFVNYPLVLYRAEKPLDKNTIVFKCDPKLTKPEIKQYLEKSIKKNFHFHINYSSIWL